MVVYNSIEEHHNADEKQVQSHRKGKLVILIEILQSKYKSSDEMAWITKGIDYTPQEPPLPVFPAHVMFFVGNPRCSLASW